MESPPRVDMIDSSSASVTSAIACGDPRDPVEAIIVEEHDLAVGRQVAIGLDERRAGGMRGRERRDRVLRDALVAHRVGDESAVSEDPGDGSADEIGVDRHAANVSLTFCGTSGR